MAKRILNFRDFNVFSLKKDVWDIAYHNHNFYEIILIEKGKGKHRLNDVTFPYKKGDVFLLAPSDAHEFKIEAPTCFIYIKFTQQFVLDNLLSIKGSIAKDQMRLLLINKPLLTGSVIKNQRDKPQVFQLAKILLHEFSNTGTFKNDLISQLFSAILLMMSRNLSKFSDSKKWINIEGERIDRILAYISVFATNRQKMKIENLAEEFMLSKNYISIYVKEKTGMSIQNHVQAFKLKTAEKLLRQSKFNINEISEKLGFIDASHFNKFFIKYNKISPLRFRCK